MFFKKKSEPEMLPAQDPILPLSDERIEKIFEEQGWHYGRDDDGDLCGAWNGHMHFFMFGESKEAFMVHSIMRQDIPLDKEAELREFIEDWHRHHFWPRAYYRVSDERGVIDVRADVNVYYEYGASNAQLLRHLKCAFGTFYQLFKAIEERFELDPVEEPSSDSE